MTRDELAQLVEQWRQRLLPEWRVILKDKPPDDEDPDFWAISQTKDDYPELLIYFTDECIARPAIECEATIVHELLHALTRPWRQQIDSVASDLANPVYARLRAARVHEEEQLVDRLARVLVAQKHDRPDLVFATRPDPETTTWA